ncbi:hypothetical protein SUDANB70_03622 [Streptomyces sp. enrichment culture]
MSPSGRYAAVVLVELPEPDDELAPEPEVVEDDVEEDDDAEDEEESDDDDFDAGELLDEEPRLSLR